ncbi:putative acyl-CoA dehydrogenase, putative exported protein [Methylorubrum extorquens]|uniref:Putative acyl-CoA dehydrogenase, putative exported protein n=1 Tax=Methylorubrum extorquens TaxID=408 RepID=A0A2N9ALQ3_METEX|nr:acyl-CoA dehydrogenase family protein [Methylorubrum zatmanii]ARO52860.1 acyl-CoA dehydrogenase [Methylorubrum zatmanii]KQQ15588.1 acyl-CoA dehydrogenase [Methylobacterium sp. Leaf121]SOR28281.1 putative acyl-CoA dehydrogenase, putative exported protein [Methylorubrum extorquens]
MSYDSSNPEPLVSPHSLLSLARSPGASRAGACEETADAQGGFPAQAIARLRRAGHLAAPLPEALGGAGLCEPARVDALRALLTEIGRGDLAVGRLFEGHVNALALVLRYADTAVAERLARDAAEGQLFGVWNTEPAEGGLVLDGADGLEGVKTYASGAGFVTRPLVTARIADGRRLMLVLRLEPGERADLSDWRVHGMRTTATGTVDFSGLGLRDGEVIGAPDDYGRQPFFFAGAWRFLAVQLGGIEAVIETHRAHLSATGRADDPHQQARFGRAMVAAETSRLLVARAARLAAAEADHPERVIAYVNLARAAVEQAGLDVITLAQRSIGLAGFLESHPLERLMRDLATYLRQPAPDFALTGMAAHALAADEPPHALWPDEVAPRAAERVG